MRRRVPAMAAFASALALALAQTAFAVAHVVSVSAGPSPFLGCVGPSGGGTNFPNTEVEPWLAVNPTNAMNLIAVYQQDRWSNGGAHGLIASASFDGGKSWNTKVTLPFDQCFGDPNYERASDPWVSFGPDGIAYSVSISFNISNNNNAVEAVTSTDGGMTWGHHHYIIRDDNQNQFFNDKESVTADPKKAGTAYVVWDRLVGPANNPAVEAHNFAAFTGPTWFSMTTDGGKTWSAPKVIVQTGQNQQTIDNQLVVAPDGTLFDFFNLILGTGPNAGPRSIAAHGSNVAFVKSTDGGATWSAPQVVDHINFVQVADPNTGATIRTHDFGAVPAVDRRTGQLYVVWQDGRFTKGTFAQILLSTSTDGGQTWSAAKVVSSSPATTHAFNPGIAVAANGSVGLYYDDFRNLQAGNTTTLPTDVWSRTAPAGSTVFGAESHVTGPFNMLVAPNAGGFFLGDYNGTVAATTGFRALFGETNCADAGCSATDPSDIVTTTF